MTRLLYPLLLIAGCAAGALPTPGDATTDAALATSGAGFVDLEELPQNQVSLDFNSDPAAIAALTAFYAPSTCIAGPGTTSSSGAGYLSAGNVEIDAEQSLTFDPSPDGIYLSMTTSPTAGEITSPLFLAQQTISVSASGAAFPAFAATLAAPSEVRVSAPDPSTAPASVDGTQDLQVTWPPTPGTTVRLRLAAHAVQLTCDFDGALGTGVLPGTQLGKLGSGPAHLLGFAVTRTKVGTESFPVAIQAVIPIFDSHGNAYSYPFTLE